MTREPSREAPTAAGAGATGGGAGATDAGLRPLAPQLAFLGATSAAIAVCDSAALAGLTGLFAGSVDGLGDSSTALAQFDWLSNWWVVLLFLTTTLALSTVQNFARERVISRWESARRAEMLEAFSQADIATQMSYSGGGLAVASEQIAMGAQTINGVSGLLNTGLRGVIYLGVAFVASPRISGVAVGVGLVLMLALRSLTRRTRQMHSRMARDKALIGEEIGDMIGSTRELHLLDRWVDVLADLGQRITDITRDRYLASALATMVGPIYWTGTLLVGLILAAVVRGTDGDLHGLAASGVLLIRALGTAQAGQMMFQTYNDAVPYMDRTRHLIDELRSARRVSGSVVPGDRPTLAFRGASLGHGGEIVISDLDLEFGGTGGVGIVGPSGSGKTTMLMALSGFLAPVTGSVTADGIPLQLVDSAQLGLAVGLLPQDPRLLRSTLRRNAVRASSEVADDEVLAALDALGLGPTVESFDAGLETRMGRGGHGFSGGELQRFGLARLAINRPRVWLLDEPTSALDKDNTARVTAVITAAMAERLVVVVTHRAELLTHCARVVLVDAGKVVDDGTLEELVERQPFVAAMVRPG